MLSIHLLVNFRNLPRAISKLSSQEVTGGSCGSTSNPANATCITIANCNQNDKR